METNIFGLVKKNFQVARVHKKMARVGSGWPKWPRVGSNLGSGFDPTHPYYILYSKNFLHIKLSIMYIYFRKRLEFHYT